MNWTTGLTFESLIDRLESSSLIGLCNTRPDRDLPLCQIMCIVRNCIQSRAKVV